MLGKRLAPVPLLVAGKTLDYHLTPDSFHAQLAAAAPTLFRDEDFGNLYSNRMGRPSVSPSQLALLLLLQHEAQVSDQEAINRSACDLRWATVLGTQAGEPLCAKSTLQEFRAQLTIHTELRAVFYASIAEAKRVGLLKGTALRIAVDTKPINGRGAVEDTFNLIASGIRQLGRAMAKHSARKFDDFLRANGLDRYAKSSLKGCADIDWSDEQARNALLTQVVGEARRLLSKATSPNPNIRAAAKLLEQLLLQDVETKKGDDGSEGSSVKAGTAKGRLPSATDPDVRHGRKSSSKRFNGHKADVAVDHDSQIIVGYNVLAGDAGDASGALELVNQVETNTDLKVAETTGDCAYGGGPTRKQFNDANRCLFAKVPKDTSTNGLFSKGVFVIDLNNSTVTCPAGHTTSRYHQESDGGKKFLFGSVCAGCPLRSLCTTAIPGRSVTVNPEEALIQDARNYQKTPEGRAHLRRRFVVEHRLARLGQLGIGQARYKGHRKTLFQLMMAAAIANFRLAWNHEAHLKPTGATNSKHDLSAHRHRNALYTMIERLMSKITAVLTANIQRRLRYQFRYGYATGKPTFRPRF
jgi:hypothetical protein